MRSPIAPAALVLAATTVAALLVACGGQTGGDESAAGCPPEPAELSVNGTRVADSVFFVGYEQPGWRQGQEVQSSRYEGGLSFAKVGIWVRRGTTVELRVPPTSLGRVQMLGWSADRSRRISFEPLQDDPCSETTWSDYPGGLLFERPQCLELEVVVDDEVSQVPFGLGRSCPGSLT